MAPSQKKKNIHALHAAAKLRGLNRLLEISSKSDDEIGRRLSAFSLKLALDETPVFLESAYQGSKAFQRGGPYVDILEFPPREAKKDPRLRNSGQLIGFRLFGKEFPLVPKNAFYDWLYIKSLFPHRDWISKMINYEGYTDIEFNPLKSVNCQARAFAELVALSSRGQLEMAAEDFSYFASLLSPI